MDDVDKEDKIEKGDDHMHWKTNQHGKDEEKADQFEDDNERVCCYIFRRNEDDDGGAGESMEEEIEEQMLLDLN